MDREKKIVILISLAAVFLISAILFFKPPFFNQWILQIECDTYDREVKRYHRALPPHPSIAIVDIDDKSIAEFGRWPWDRALLAQLASQLQKMGASVIAFDMIFSEAQTNPVDAVLKANPSLQQELQSLKSQLDPDAAFSSALKQGTNVLGFAFASNGKGTGLLPPPLFTLSDPESLIPSLDGFIGNQPAIQEAAGRGGFINTTVDSDGILRFSPLLMQDKGNVYPSLALEAAMLFLRLPFTGLLTTASKVGPVIQSIQLGDKTIPTDPWGRILIPYRGPPFSFPYLSAIDVLQGKIDPAAVQGKLLFIGLTATASSDLLATAISPVFPGVEVQASIASGIIDGYLPHKPNWGRGAAVGLVLLLGAIASFLFPYISRLAAFAISVGILFALEAINYWLWTRHALVLSFFFPLPTLATIFILDLISMYLSDLQQKKELKRVFGPSVPAKTLDTLLKNKKDFPLTGEKKEVSVLSAGIWNFEALAKTLPAEELASFLNFYFNQTGLCISEKKGLLCPSMRDQLSALWGAPLPEPRHPFLAVEAALLLQSKLPDLNRQCRIAKISEIQIGIGIDSGPAAVGNFRGYSAIGAPSDRSLRFQSLTETYCVGIIAGSSLYDQTQEQVVFRKLDRLPDLGEIYEPLCLKEHLTPELASELALHQEALFAYLNKNTEKSDALFRQLQSLYPHRKALYSYYLRGQH